MSNDLKTQILADKAEIDLVAEAHNESSSLSWLWSFLFGPIYFWVHGFVGIGFLVLALNFIIIGFFIPPFIVYPLWRKRARNRAEKLVAVNKMTRNNGST